MTDDYVIPNPAAAPIPPTPRPPRNRMLGLKIALVGAGVAAGAIGATALGASAASSSSTTAPSSGSSSSSSTTAPGVPDNDGDGHGGPGAMHGVPGGANPVRNDEKSLSSDVVAKLRAAALAKVPGGTVVRVETDSGDAAYEAHMTKSDGSVVTVKFDKNYAVTAVEDGMGR